MALTSRNPLPLVPLLFLLALLLLLTGCSEKIGDSCRNAQDCAADHVCDTSAQNGYCTIFDCRDDQCPGGSVCVDFELVRACMKTCTRDNECRTGSGHICRDDFGETPFCYNPPDEDFSTLPSLPSESDTETTSEAPPTSQPTVDVPTTTPDATRP